MRTRSPAKRPASEPPAPGRISTRHDKCAKGCIGIKLVLSTVAIDWRSSVADMSSSSAIDFNSESVAGSRRIFWSSEKDCVKKSTPF